MLSVVAVSAKAHANPIVDGFWDTQNAELYNITQEQYIDGQNSAVKWTGALGIYQQGNMLYLMFAQPTSINDNSYGANRVGWPGNGHTNFTDLQNSDRAEFVLKVGSTTIWDGLVDYVSPCNGVYVSAGVLGNVNGCSHSDGSMVIGSASAVLGAATSIQWDLNSSCWAGSAGITTNSPSTGSNTPNAAYNNDNPPGCTSTAPAGYAPGHNWLFENLYEVALDLNQIANGAYANLAFGTTGNGGAGTCAAGTGCVDVTNVHDSPSKITTSNGDCGVLCEQTTTPEPATFALLGTGLLGLSGFVKRRRMIL
jgi:hypothetical protein